MAQLHFNQARILSPLRNYYCQLCHPDNKILGFFLSFFITNKCLCYKLFDIIKLHLKILQFDAHLHLVSSYSSSLWNVMKQYWFTVTGNIILVFQHRILATEKCFPIIFNSTQEHPAVLFSLFRIKIGTCKLCKTFPFQHTCKELKVKESSIQESPSGKH